MKNRAFPLIMLALAACSHQRTTAHAPVAAEAAPVRQVAPAILGKRRPGTRITSDNMPLFDTVAYCEWATRKQDAMPKGPLYEQCIQDEQHYALILGQTIDGKKFKDADIERCAKASLAAFQGEWFCLHGY